MRSVEIVLHETTGKNPPRLGKTHQSTKYSIEIHNLKFGYQGK